MSTFAPITNLQIQGFKCFENLSLDLGRLTIFSGLNGAGKSTAIQSLLLTAQRIKMYHPPLFPVDFFSLNGPLAELGTASEVLSSGLDGKMRFSFTTSSDEYFCEMQHEVGSSDLLISKESDLKRLGAAANTLSRVEFLSAKRISPRSSYPNPRFRGRTDIDIDGRHTPHVYESYADESFSSVDGPSMGMNKSLRLHFKESFEKLFPGMEANVVELRGTAGYSLEFKHQNEGDWRQPVNSGFGLTSAFPVLVRLLFRKTPNLSIIDSPETHLHPSAQSTMGKILCEFAQSDTQIIVETHSDHILNGIRLAVKEGIIKNEDVKIYFFSGVSPESNGVTALKVAQDGTISDWPNGFFDQSEIDLAKLIGWN